MKRKLIISGIIVLILVLSLFGLFLFYVYPIKLIGVSYEVKEKNIIAHIRLSDYVSSGTCETKDEKVEIEKGSCTLTLPNIETEITVKTKWNEKTFKIDPDQNEVLDFSLSETKVYMAVGEKKEIYLTIDELGNPNITSTFLSSDENILKTEGNTLIAVGPGTVTVEVKVGNITKEMEVISTDLLTIPTLNPNKSYLPCGRFTDEENALLDEFLSYRVNSAGFKTRGGVVAAARFITLEFPYKLNYFWENGRLNNNTGGPAADGEGRYYHRGLYLSNSKFQTLDQSKIRFGPSTWGCPLTNWQDDPMYGFVPGRKMPNGLDCSGFVSWVLHNGGFDPKDSGAGDTPSVDDDLGDFGPHIPITYDLLESNTIKPGDIIASDGHVALVGGIHDGKVYVAESTTYYRGVSMHTYTYQELVETPYLTYVINMDDYYEEEGIYTNFWE